MNQYYKVLKFILTIAMLVVMVGLVYYMLFLLVKDIYLAFDVVAGFFCDDWIPYVAFLIFVVLFMGEFVRLFTEIIEFLFKSF